MQELCASNRVFAGARALPAARRTAVPAVARLPARRRSGAPALAAAARHAPHGCSCCAHDAGVASPSGRGALGLGAAPPLARQQQLARGRRGAAVAAAAAPGATPEATASCGAAWQQQQLQRMFSKHQHAQQAHEQAAAPAAPPAPAPAPAARPPPFAALTRLLLTGQNSYYFRNALTQRRAGGGPISLLLFVLTIVAAMVAAVRGALVRKVKACKTCRGFGVCRCRLCNGEGRVDWAAKLSHYGARAGARGAGRAAARARDVAGCAGGTKAPMSWGPAPGRHVRCWGALHEPAPVAGHLACRATQATRPCLRHLPAARPPLQPPRPAAPLQTCAPCA